LRFYKSETYKKLQQTENGLWAENAEYILDNIDELRAKGEIQREDDYYTEAFIKLFKMFVLRG